MRAYVFFLPDGRQYIVNAFEDAVPELQAGLGAIAFGLAEQADEIEAALYGAPVCPLCSVLHTGVPSVDLRLSNMDRPPNRLPLPDCPVVHLEVLGPC